MSQQTHNLNWLARTDHEGEYHIAKLPIDTWFLWVRECKTHTRLQLRYSLDLFASVGLIDFYTNTRGVQAKVALIDMAVSYLDIIMSVLKAERASLMAHHGGQQQC